MVATLRFSIVSVLFVCPLLRAQQPPSDTETSLPRGAQAKSLDEVRAKYDPSTDLLTDRRLGFSVKLPGKPKCVVIEQKGELMAPPQVKNYELTHDGIDYVVGGVLLPSRMRGQVGKAISAEQVVDGMRKNMLADASHFRRILNNKITDGGYEGCEEVIRMQQAKIDGQLHERAVIYARTLITQRRAFTAQATIGEATYEQDKEGYKSTLVSFLRSLKIESAKEAGAPTAPDAAPPK